MPTGTLCGSSLPIRLFLFLDVPQGCELLWGICKPSC
jgi:hypothetical protein